MNRILLLPLLMLLPCGTGAAAEPRGVEARTLAALERLRQTTGTEERELDPVLLERPLFIPGRRPPADEGPADGKADPAPSPALDFALRGIVRQGEETWALMTPRGESRTRRLRTGDRIGQWRLVEILPDRVVLGQGSRKKTLLLHHYPPVKPGHRKGRRPGPPKRKASRRQNR